MLIKRKKNSILEWLNCILILDGPLESLQQLSDGRHFKELIGLIDPTGVEELSEDTDIYEFIEEFLNGYFEVQVGTFIDPAACSQGVEMELAKVSILLLSAVVQNSLTKETDFLSDLTNLDDSVQEDIKDYMQAVMLPHGDKLTADFSLVLSQRKYSGSSTRQTPRRNTRKSSVLTPPSPLMTLIDSPVFARQIKIRNLEARVSSLNQLLHAEENKAGDFEVENSSLKQSVKSKEHEVKELREKLREFQSSTDSEEESKWTLNEQLTAEVQSLTNQLKNYQNIQAELSRLQKENEELSNCNRNLHSQLEDYKMTKTEVQKFASDLNQAQVTIEGQKEFIENIQIENNNLKRVINEKENEVNMVHSLYEDAMQEVRNYQNSPELPKGESMKVVVEMQVEELEKEIRHLKKQQVKLRDRLKTSAQCNESMKKDLAASEEKFNELEERLTNEKQSLQETLNSLSNELNQQKAVQEKKAKAHIAEIDHLKNMSKQQQDLYEEKLAKLRTGLSDMNFKLKACTDTENEKVAQINQLRAQNDILSHEWEQKAREMSERECGLRTLLACKEKEICELKSSVDVIKQENYHLQQKVQDLHGETVYLKQRVEQESKVHTAEYEEKMKLLEELSNLNSKYHSENEEYSQKSLNQTVAEENWLLHELELMKTKLRETEEKLSIFHREKDSCEFHLAVSALREENRCLEEKIQNLNAENHKLKMAEQLASEAHSSDIQCLKREYDKQLELCKGRESQANALPDEVSQWKTEYDGIQLKFSKQVEVCDGLRNALDKLVIQNIDLQKQLETSRVEYDELVKKSASTEQNCIVLAAQKKEKDKEAESLSRQIRDLQNTLNQTDEKYKTDAREMQGRVECLKEKKDADLKKAENSLQEATKANTELTNENYKLKFAEAKLTESIGMLEGSNKEKDELVKSLSMQVQTLHNLLRQTNQIHSNKLKEMKDLIGNLKQENKSVKDRNHSIEEKRASVEKELQKAKECMESKDMELRKTKDSLKEAGILHAELSDELQQLKLEKSKLEEQFIEKIRLYMNGVDFKNALAKILDESREDVNTLIGEISEGISEQLQILKEAQAHRDANYREEVEKFKSPYHGSQGENEVLMSEHSVQVENQNCQIDQIEKLLEKAKREIQEFEESCRKNDSMQKDLREVIEETENVVLSTLSLELSSAIESMKALLEKGREDNKGLQSYGENYVSEKLSLSQGMAASGQSISSLTEPKQDEEVHELSKQMQDFQHAHKQKDVIHELRSESLHDLLQKLESDHVVLTQILNCWIEGKSEFEKFQAHVQQLKELKLQEDCAIESLQRMLEELKTPDSSLPDELINLQAEALKNVQRASFLESEITRLTSRYQEKETEINNKMKGIEDENEYLKKEIIIKDEKMNELLALLKSIKENKASELSEPKEEIESLKELLETVTGERDDLEIHVEALDAYNEHLMGKLQDTERRYDHLVRQREISESDFALCVVKRDQDIEKLNKRIQELEVKSGQLDKKTSESKMLTEIQNLKETMQQKEIEMKKTHERIHELDNINKQKDVSLQKIKNSMEEMETTRRKLVTEISCLNEEKKIDKEKIDKLTTECQRLSSYNQQQKEMIEEMKDIQRKLMDSGVENKAVQEKYLEHKKKNEQRIEMLKKTTAKLEKEKEEMEKCLLSLKQKVVGYQNVSESCKQELAEEQQRLRAATMELVNSKELRDQLNKRIYSLEQSLVNHKLQKSCLEGEIRRTRTELNLMKTRYEQDFTKPVSRRFSSALSPYASAGQQTDSPTGDNPYETPRGQRIATVKKRMSNASSLASCVSISSETINISAPTPIKAGANLFLPLADEEDFLNFSSILDLKSGPHSPISSMERLSELRRRNTLCPPHMRSSYPVETQTRPACEFSDEVLKSGVVASDESQGGKVLAEKRPNASRGPNVSRGTRQNINRVMRENGGKFVSPKRKRIDSDDTGPDRVKVKKFSAKTTEAWAAFKASVASPKTDVFHTPTALKNIFRSKKKGYDTARKMKGKRF